MAAHLKVSQKLNTHRIFKRLAKALIRLRICAGWSEALLVARPHCWKSHVAAHFKVEIWQIDLDAIKPASEISDKARLKPISSATETS